MLLYSTVDCVNIVHLFRLSYLVYFLIKRVICIVLTFQCFDTVGWATERASDL